MRYIVCVLTVVLISSIAAAQVTIGSMPVAGGWHKAANVWTTIDLTHPATADGTLTSASIRWDTDAASSCPAAFKLKFVRPSGLSTYTVQAERGPFDARKGVTVVTLSPPVPVKEGDLIAVTQVGSCGSFMYSETSHHSSAVMDFTGEIPNSGSLNGMLLRGKLLNVRATSEASVLEGVIAGAGSLAGGYGSRFRTALQITNYDESTATGTLIFHPAATSGSSSDPSISFSVPKRSTVSYTDVIESMGHSGLGSVDVVSTSGSCPFMTIRVFNDAAGGTSGFTEDLVAPQDALHGSHQTVITMPADLTNFRMNVGVRTFDAGATLRIVATDAGGSTILTERNKTAYPANYYEQVGLQQFLENVQPVANGILHIFVQSGSAVIYATTTDNRTNDSSIDFAQRE